MNLDATEKTMSIVPRVRAKSRYSERLRTARFAISIAGAVLLSACSTFTPRFERPELSVVDVRLLGGNLFQQKFRVTFDIQNPNDRALPVDHVSANLVMAGEPVASGATSRTFVVPARGETRFDMIVVANMATSLVQLAQRLNGADGAVDYELDGVVRLDLPLFHSLPFHEKGSFSLPDASR